MPPQRRVGFLRDKSKGDTLTGPFRADELDDRRDQLGGHDHDGLTLGPEGRFVFGNLFVVGLVVVVLGQLEDSLLIPAGGIRPFFLPGHFLLLRRRLRNARFALGVRSKTEATNALAPPASWISCLTVGMGASPKTSRPTAY